MPISPTKPRMQEPLPKINLQRSKSRSKDQKQPKGNERLEKSRSKSKSKAINQKKTKNDPKNKKGAKLDNSRSRSKSRSAVKKQASPSKNLNRSKSEKKLQQVRSKSRVKVAPQTERGKNPKGSVEYASQKQLPNSRGPVKDQERSPRKVRLNSMAPSQQQQQQEQQSSPVGLKAEEKQMGLIYFRPQHDKVLLKALDITDPVFDKYLEMINNDNDPSYTLNAMPQLREFRREEDADGRDFVSGKVTRASGIFDGVTVDKLISCLKRVPNYYQGPCGRNLQLNRLVLQTRYKVEVDLGFLQYSVDGDKITIFRIYLSKIYRRMNYICFAYLETLRQLLAKHSGADRWSIFILERNMGVHKFHKYLGFHIEKIATDSKNRTVDYFQEFTIRKKDLQTVLASLK